MNSVGCISRISEDCLPDGADTTWGRHDVLSAISLIKTAGNYFFLQTVCVFRAGKKYSSVQHLDTEICGEWFGMLHGRIMFATSRN